MKYKNRNKIRNIIIVLDSFELVLGINPRCISGMYTFPPCNKIATPNTFVPCWVARGYYYYLLPMWCLSWTMLCSGNVWVTMQKNLTVCTGTISAGKYAAFPSLVCFGSGISLQFYPVSHFMLNTIGLWHTMGDTLL